MPRHDLRTGLWELLSVHQLWHLPPPLPPTPHCSLTKLRRWVIKSKCYDNHVNTLYLASAEIRPAMDTFAAAIWEPLWILLSLDEVTTRQDKHTIWNHRGLLWDLSLTSTLISRSPINVTCREYSTPTHLHSLITCNNTTSNYRYNVMNM